MFFVFTDTATTEIYTLSLHDALPILARLSRVPDRVGPREPEFSTQLLHVTGRARQERPSRTDAVRLGVPFEHRRRVVLGCDGEGIHEDVVASAIILQLL